MKKAHLKEKEARINWDIKADVPNDIKYNFDIPDLVGSYDIQLRLVIKKK